MFRRTFIAGSTVALLAVCAGPASSATPPRGHLVGGVHYDYWVMTNDYEPNKVDFYGFLKWKGGEKRFCYQEWTFVHSRSGPWVRQRAYTAKRVTGTNYYVGHDFTTPHSNPIKIRIKATNYGHRLSMKFLSAGVSLTEQLQAVTRSTFLRFNRGNPPSWTPCPRF